MINLQEFIDGFKKSEVVFGKNKRVFREPTLKDVKLTIDEILSKYCIEGKYEDFKEKMKEIPVSKHQEIINKILEELGLV